MTDVRPAVVPRVGLIVIATGRYSSFLPALMQTARRHVTGLHRVYVLADARPPCDALITWLPWGHLGWPYPTLLRYRAISAYADVLRNSNVLVYVDVDMRFVGEFDVTGVSGVFAVRHPGYVDTRPEDLPYERNPESRSCVSPAVGTRYFAGGVQGGTAPDYLAAAEEMSRMVQLDLDNRLVPVWHDESVWNARCVEKPPDVELPASYCTPEGHEDASTVLVALDKDHDHLRDVPRRERLRRRATQARRRLRSLVLSPLSRIWKAMRR